MGVRSFSCAASLTVRLTADRIFGQQQEGVFTLGSCGNEREAATTVLKIQVPVVDLLGVHLEAS